MGAAREFLERAFDFLLFVAACVFLLGGFAKVAAMQDTLEDSLAEKGQVMVANAYPDARVSGEEIIALLLWPDGLGSICIDGVWLDPESGQCVHRIDPEKSYIIRREPVAGGILLDILALQEG